MRTLKILVIDDDDMVRKFLKDFLKFHKYEVEVAVNGQEAYENIVKKINKLKKLPDLIITDLEMPKMSGEELAGKIGDLNASSGSNIRVILMGGNHNGLDRIKKTAPLIADLFLYKPFSLKSLLVKVENLLR